MRFPLLILGGALALAQEDHSQSPTRRCRPRHGELSDVLQRLGAEADFSRSGSAAFVRL